MIQQKNSIFEVLEEKNPTNLEICSYIWPKEKDRKVLILVIQISVIKQAYFQ